MKDSNQQTAYLFVDEAGDPVFYGKGKTVIVGNEGCSRTLMLGFIEVDDPQHVRDTLGRLRRDLAADKYLAPISSVAKSLLSFHAKDDCPEVRMLVYKALGAMSFKAHVIVARKIEAMFNATYGRQEGRFYDDLVTRLFQNRLHLATHNLITFSRRGNKLRYQQLQTALELAKNRFEARQQTAVASTVELRFDQPQQEPVLQVIDYALWAVQRAYERGEMRYFDFLREKYSLVYDVFDRARYPKGGNYYTRDRNPFEIKKISPLG
jgi:hypothetical protein